MKSRIDGLQQGRSYMRMIHKNLLIYPFRYHLHCHLPLNLCHLPLYPYDDPYYNPWMHSVSDFLFLFIIWPVSGHGKLAAWDVKGTGVCLVKGLVMLSKDW